MLTLVQDVFLRFRSETYQLLIFYSTYISISSDFSCILSIFPLNKNRNLQWHVFFITEISADVVVADSFVSATLFCGFSRQSSLQPVHSKVFEVILTKQISHIILQNKLESMISSSRLSNGCNLPNI